MPHFSLGESPDAEFAQVWTFGGEGLVGKKCGQQPWSCVDHVMCVSYFSCAFLTCEVSS